MSQNQTQRVLQVLRNSDTPRSAISICVGEVMAPDVVTRALWALRAAGLARSERVGLGVFWVATTPDATYCPRCGDETVEPGDPTCGRCDLGREATS